MDRFLRIAAAVAVAISTTAVLIPPAAAAARPDLKVTSVSKPPSSLRRGRTINITDITKNVGKAKAKASTTRYYISKDSKRGGLADIRLAKSRKVKILGKGKSHKGTVKGVVIPKTVAPASYFVLACADDPKRVRESNEKNNCRASTTRMAVSAGPPVPNITGTTPPSPNNDDDTPLVKGTAESGSTVRVFVGACSGTPVATGPASTFASSGLLVGTAVTANVPVNYVANATDNVGNVSACSTGDPQGAYLYDTALPDPPTLVVFPMAISNDPTPTWTWTGESGATFACELMKGSTVVQSVACDSSTYTAPDLSAPEHLDGEYDFSVVQTDAAGNVAADATTDDFILDLTPPAPAAILSEPITPSNDPNPTWTFNGGLSSDAFYECRLSRNGTVVFPFTACGDATDDSETYDLSAAATYPDGTYVFEVRQTDAAGNSSTPDASDDPFVLDRIALPPTFVQEPTDPSNDAIPVWDFVGEDGASFECTLRDGADVIIDGPEDCTSDTTYTFDLSDDVTYPDGDYALTVRQTDLAGNQSTGEAPSTFELDRQAPDPPAVVFTGTDPSNDVTPTWTFTGEPGATFQCSLMRGSTPVESGACNSGSFTPTVALASNGSEDGSYTLEVRQTDDASNQSAATASSFVLDTIAPNPPTIQTEPNDPTNDTTPTWTFTTDETDPVTYQCVLKRGVITVESIDCSGGSFSPSVPLAADGSQDGAYTIEVRQRDEATNQSTASSSSFELDTTPPAAPTFTQDIPADPSNDTTPSWSWTGEADATYDCLLEKGSTEIESVSCNGATYTSPDLASHGDGTFTLTVSQTDEAGNPAPLPGVDSFVLDTDPPDAPVFSDVPDDPTNVLTPSWSWTGEAGATYDCTLMKGTTEIDAGECDAATYTSPDLGSAGDGTYTLEVLQTDEADNPALDLATDSFVLDTLEPVAPTSLTSNPASPADDETPAIEGTVVGEPNVSITLFVGNGCDGTAAGTGTTDGAGDFSVVSSASVTVDTSRTFYAQATDQAGNVGDCSDGFLYEHPVTESGIPNEDTFSAQDLGESPTTAVGQLSDADPFDFWKVFVAEGSSLKLETFDPARDGSGELACSAQTQTVIELFDDDAVTSLVIDDDDGNGGAGPCSLIDGTGPGDPPQDQNAANLTTQDGEGGFYFVKVSRDAPEAGVVPYRLVVEDGAVLLESEPNDGVDTLTDTVISDGNMVDDTLIKGEIDTIRQDVDGDGTFEIPGDRDFFKLNLAQSSVVRFESFNPDGQCPAGMQTTLSWFHPNALLPATGPTETSRFKSEAGTSGNAGGVGTCSALTMLVPAGISYLQIEESGRNATIPAYFIEVDVLATAVSEVEPTNDDLAGATDIPLDSERFAEGSFVNGDEDWYKFTLTETSSVRLETIEGGLDVAAGGTDPTCDSNSIRTRVTLYGTTQTELISDPVNVLASGADGRGACSVIDGTGTGTGTGAVPRDAAADNLGPGTYYVRVMSASDQLPQPPFAYRLVVNARPA